MREALLVRVRGQLALLRMTTNLSSDWLKAVATQCENKSSGALLCVLDALKADGYDLDVSWQRTEWIAGIGIALRARK